MKQGAIIPKKAVTKKETVKPDGVGRLDETHVAFQDPSDMLEKGIELCRQGNWKDGFELLSTLAQQQNKPGELPGRYYSYLGYGMALHEKRYDEAIKLCRYAIKREFYQTENYVNLARTCMLAGKRKSAWKAVERGLSIDANNPDLQELHGKLGKRHQPIVSFLSRANPINHALGSMRQTTRRGKGGGSLDDTMGGKSRVKPGKGGGRRQGSS